MKKPTHHVHATHFAFTLFTTIMIHNLLNQMNHQVGPIYLAHWDKMFELISLLQKYLVIRLWSLMASSLACY